MQLYKEDGTPIINVDIYVEFTYDQKKDDICVRCRDIPSRYNNHEQALWDLLCICEDSLLFRLDSKIEYCPEAVLGYIDGKEEPVHIDGYFIARFQNEDDTIILTNAPDATVFMGCAEFLANFFTKKNTFSKYVEIAVSQLKSIATSIEEAGERKKCTLSSLAKELFDSGSTAVKCSSREEYEDFVIWLIANGYHITDTVNPLRWNELTQYIICKENKEVYATHRLKNGIETVIKYSSILK